MTKREIIEDGPFLFKLILDRDGLETIMQFLSTEEKVSVGVDENGMVTFDIPKNSNIKIKNHDPLNILYKKVKDIQSQIEKTKLKKDISKLKKEMDMYFTVAQFLYTEIKEGRYYEDNED